MNWKYISKLKDQNFLWEVESIFEVELPEDFKKIINENNAGYPEKEGFDTSLSKERVFGNLLDFNLNEEFNIIRTFNQVKELLPVKTFPFGVDPGGNFICFDYRNSERVPQIIFLKHEGYLDEDGNECYNTEFIANSFNEFINQLYDPEEDHIIDQ